jgi:hyaluronan synthase
MYTKLFHRIFYLSLFVVLFMTAYFFIARLAFDTTGSQWQTYSRVYVLALLAHTWFIFILLFYESKRKITYPAYAGEKISVIVPCYNEEPNLLLRSVESVINAKGNKEIIIIDDGSTNNVRPLLEKLAKHELIQVHFFDRNKGKRHALHHAIKEMIRDSKFVVTIDSDTILDPDAFIRVVEPLKNPKIGASTGDVRLLNEKQNLLTRMIATYYWIGLNIYKKAQSSQGNVVCCSGCLAAYRTDILKEIIDEFVNQEFFGERCTHSEDRHLTNLILKRNYDVVYTEAAISWTETPASIKGFLKQQQRWKRGFIRESTYTLTHAWKKRKLLFFQILFWDLGAPFFTFGLRMAVLVTTILHPLFFLSFILPVWILFMFVRYIFVFILAREKIIGLFVYMVFYEVFLYWMNIYALFTVRNKSWITR